MRSSDEANSVTDPHRHLSSNNDDCPDDKMEDYLSEINVEFCVTTGRSIRTVHTE